MVYAVGKPGPGLGWIGTQCGGVKPVNGIATPPFDNLISNGNTYVNKRKKNPTQLPEHVCNSNRDI